MRGAGAIEFKPGENREIGLATHCSVATSYAKRLETRVGYFTGNFLRTTSWRVVINSTEHMQGRLIGSHQQRKCIALSSKEFVFLSKGESS